MSLVKPVGVNGEGEGQGIRCCPKGNRRTEEALEAQQWGHGQGCLLEFSSQ